MTRAPLPCLALLCLALLAGCAGGSPRDLPERTLRLGTNQSTGQELGVLAPMWDRFVVRLARGEGLKVWLEVDGQPVGRLGLRHAWATPAPAWDDPRFQLQVNEDWRRGRWIRTDSQSPPDLAWILVRDVELAGLAQPHRNVEVVLAGGRLDPEDPSEWAPELHDPSARAFSWAVPVPEGPLEPRRLLQFPLEGLPAMRSAELLCMNLDVLLRPGEPVVVAELPSTRQVRLLVELVAPSG